MAGEAYPKQFRDLTKIFNGTTPASDLKMSDIFPIQHVDSSSATNTLNQVTVAQCLCQPVAVVNNTPNDGRYTADCVNFPDFSIRDTDNNHILYGLKVRVSFPNGITYGSVSGGTCPELNINGSGSLKMLAQGKTMAAGAASAGQTMEFTLIPYGNGEIAWDADSNVRESTSDYTIYTDGSFTYTERRTYSIVIPSNSYYDLDIGDKGILQSYIVYTYFGLGGNKGIVSNIFPYNNRAIIRVTNISTVDVLNTELKVIFIRIK